MNKKIIATLFLLAIVIVSGATYAWYAWTSPNNTNVTFNIQGTSVTYNASAITKNLIPTASRTNSKNIIETITASATQPMYFTLYLELTTLPTTLKHESFKYALYEGTTTLLTSGNFASYSQGNVITLLNRSAINSTTRTLTLYIWIDGTISNPSTMQNQTFSFNLRADATDSPS